MEIILSFLKINYRKVIIVLLFLISPGLILATDASDIQNQINNLQQDINYYQRRLQQTQEEEDSLENAINTFNQQIADYQNQINDTQFAIDNKQKEIIETENQIQVALNQIKEQKKILNQAVILMYQEGDTPFVEIFFSAQTFSDALDRVEYFSTIELTIDDTICKIEKLQKQLEDQKKKQEKEKQALSDLKNQLASQLANVSAQKKAKDKLLIYTQSSERVYQEKLSDLSQKQLALSQWLGWFLNQNSTPIYGDWDGKCWNNCDSQYSCDPQCVAYVTMRSGVGISGNAHEWDDNALKMGYTVDSTPKVGDIMVWDIGYGMPYGHVAYVESVSANSITVSQSNWACNCCYSEMTIPKTSWTKFIHLF